MICVACGAGIPDGGSFCPKCGLKVGSAPSTQAGIESPQFNRKTDGVESEQELWVGTYSGKAMVGGWIAGVLVSIGLIVVAVLFEPALFVSLALLALVWIVLAATLAYRKLDIRYELTTQRLIHRSGILTRRTDHIEVIDIDDVTFKQGIVQRMFNVGSVLITSSDRSHPELLLPGIDDVKLVADTIDRVRRKERHKRGLHIEHI